MFIGHLPAGYLLTRSLYAETSGRKSARKIWMTTGLLCSVLPDVDLIYFYLIDNRQHLHHGYWTHLPIFWLIIIFLMWTGIAISGKKGLMPWLKLGGLNILVHLLLDTIVGKIRWLYPLSRQDYYLFEVPSLYNHFVLNFVLHWSFSLEIVLCAAAGYVFLKNLKLFG
jgi:inner membrane protein